MPAQDWTKVPAGIFHHFHLEWIAAIAHALNRGLLPKEYYALAEQYAGVFGSDVLTLQVPARTARKANGPRNGTAVLTKPRHKRSRRPKWSSTAPSRRRSPCATSAMTRWSRSSR